MRSRVRVVPIAGVHTPLPVVRPTVGVGGATTHRDADFHRYYGGRRVWPIRADMEPLGADPVPAPTATSVQLDAATKNLQDQQSQLKKDMIQAAAKVTAVQVGISVALLFIPIVGWALAAINAVVAVIFSALAQRNKKKLQAVIAGIKTHVDAYQAQAQVEIHAQEQVISDQLWPDAVALANSGQSLDGLGDFWSNLRDDAKKAVRSVATAVVKFHTIPVKILGQQVIKGVRSVAGAVHDTSLQKKLAGKEDAWAAEIDRSTKQTSAALTNLDTLKNDAVRAVGLVTGEEQIRVAEQKGAEIEAAARQQIDAYKADTLAHMQTPEYRTELTRNLARAIRGDPTLQQEANYYQSQEQAKAVQNGLPANTVVPTVKSSSGGTLAAVGALVGAFFLLKHR